MVVAGGMDRRGVGVPGNWVGLASSQPREELDQIAELHRCEDFAQAFRHGAQSPGDRLKTFGVMLIGKDDGFQQVGAVALSADAVEFWPDRAAAAGPDLMAAKTLCGRMCDEEGTSAGRRSPVQCVAELGEWIVCGSASFDIANGVGEWLGLRGSAPGGVEYVESQAGSEAAILQLLEAGLEQGIGLG